MIKSSQLFLILTLIASGCAHAPHSDSISSDAPSSDWKTTSIEIQYKLHNTQRKLMILPDTQGVHGRSIVDGSQLKQCQIDATRYQDFLSKVRSFMDHQRVPASAQNAMTAECRAPYKIVLKNPKDTAALEGCRLSDEGAFSHLVQEGEFLIYRQK
jgi:hypothetical protein